MPGAGGPKGLEQGRVAQGGRCGNLQDGGKLWVRSSLRAQGGPGGGGRRRRGRRSPEPCGRQAGTGGTSEDTGSQCEPGIAVAAQGLEAQVPTQGGSSWGGDSGLGASLCPRGGRGWLPGVRVLWEDGVGRLTSSWSLCSVVIWLRTAQARSDRH